jgi:hypothetical protein
MMGEGAVWIGPGSGSVILAMFVAVEVLLLYPLGAQLLIQRRPFGKPVVNVDDDLMEKRQPLPLGVDNNTRTC